MATIFNREIDGVTISYDTEAKNQLGDKAVAECTKKSMGRQAVYTFKGTTDAVAFVKLDKETLDELGEPASLDSEKALTKLSEGVYYVKVDTHSSWSQLTKTIKLTFKNEKSIKLDVIDVGAEA